MIGHLGTRVSALLDGQLSAKEAEEAWSHVYSCHSCRDLVEREGWVKTRLAGLGAGDRQAPSGLKGSLLSMPPGERYLAEVDEHRASRRSLGAAAIGGGAVGAAMLGVIAIGLVPSADRRPPVNQVDTTVVRPAGSTTAPVRLDVVPDTPLRRMLP
ncbi:hypothetical protein KG112_07215 [Nocardioides sp. zg-ZUI104]|uniref:anti-sigma factor family protein n=1 Tax=Nocardioides faecalis TaxID=2803858 RepID=UPI001BCECB7A|nr:hypothetical protein [Nocardioides faecalis]MBS4752597.1 hypothetical protein [Nocardioides faecalis]